MKLACFNTLRLLACIGMGSALEPLESLLASGKSDKLCSTLGFSCDSSTLSLEQLYLPQQLVHSPPQFLSSLHQYTTLKVVDLSSNQLTDIINQTNFPFPNSLEFLNLANNSLSGPFLADLPDRLPNLRKLYLHSNYFYGAIPTSWLRFRFLEDYCLTATFLTGLTPPGLRRSNRVIVIRAYSFGQDGTIHSFHNSSSFGGQDVYPSNLTFTLSIREPLHVLTAWANQAWRTLHTNSGTRSQAKASRRGLDGAVAVTELGINPPVMNLGFVLRGEASYGMSPLPLYQIRGYTSEACSALTFDQGGQAYLDVQFVKFDDALRYTNETYGSHFNGTRAEGAALLSLSGLPLEYQSMGPSFSHRVDITNPAGASPASQSVSRRPRAIDIRHIRAQEVHQMDSDVTKAHHTVSTILNDFLMFGFCVLSVPPEDVAIVNRGYGALKDWMTTVPEDQKFAFRMDNVRELNGQMVGFLSHKQFEGARDTLMLKAGMRARTVFGADNSHNTSWPERGLEHVEHIMNSVDLLGNTILRVWRHIVPYLGLVHDPVDDHSYTASGIEGTCTAGKCSEEALQQQKTMMSQTDKSNQFKQHRQHSSSIHVFKHSVSTKMCWYSQCPVRSSGGGGGGGGGRRLRSRPSIDYNASFPHLSSPESYNSDANAPGVSGGINMRAGQLPEATRPAGKTIPGRAKSRIGDPARKAGTGIHTDHGLLTLTPLGTEPGMIVFHPRTGQPVFIDMELAANEWLLFPGDMLSFVSNGRFPALVHRVICPDPVNPASHEPRMSMPTFLTTKKHMTQVDSMVNISASDFTHKHIVTMRPFNQRLKG